MTPDDMRRSTFTDGVTALYRGTHERILIVVGALSAHQWTRQFQRTAPPVPLLLWHVAREADQLQAHLPQMTAVLGMRLGTRRQIWEADGLAARWGGAAALGGAAERAMRGDEFGLLLAAPGREMLLDYARQAFAAAERALGAVDDRQWRHRDATASASYGELHMQPRQGASVGDAILAYLALQNQRLGAVEYLCAPMGARAKTHRPRAARAPPRTPCRPTEPPRGRGVSRCKGHGLAWGDPLRIFLVPALR